MNFSLLDCEGAHLLNFSGQAWSWKVLICCEVWICVFTGAMMIWVTRDSVGDSDKVDSFYSLTRIVNFQYIDHAGFFLLFVVFTSTFLTKVINGSWYNGRKSTNLSIPSQKAFQFWRCSIRKTEIINVECHHKTRSRLWHAMNFSPSYKSLLVLCCKR